MLSKRRIAALIVAAGSGERARGNGAQLPKQFAVIGGRSVLQRSIDAFAALPEITEIHVVIGDGQRDLFDAAVQSASFTAVHTGGPTRQASVRNGLAAMAQNNPDIVLVHDAARPFASAALIRRVIAGLDNADAALPVQPVTSTLKRVENGAVVGTVSRAGLFAAETPQGFTYRAIADAHERAANLPEDFTDDAAIAEWAGMKVKTVAGEAENIKLTTAEDIASADKRLTAEDLASRPDVRTGIGYDVHTLGPGSEIWLGGIAIPHTRGLVGHSDADVILHALTDALLGALGDGDIGKHFPPSDERWKGAASDAFLKDAIDRVHTRGGIIAHLDVTYVGEGPKLSPYREAMRERIAEIAGITVDRIGVKATTNEGVGFIGRGEGAAAHAVATIRLPL